MSAINCFPLRSLAKSSLCGFLSLVAFFFASPAQASERNFRMKQAARLVDEALHATLDDGPQRRQALLAEACKQIPEYPPAMWHQGYIRAGKRWIHIDELGQQRRPDKRLAEYERLRATTLEFATDHWRLANWCRSNGLIDQQRAHLSRALDLSPGNPTILRTLGYVFVQGEWMAPDRLREAVERSVSDRAKLAFWTPQLNELLKGMRSTNPRKRTASEAELASLREPAAIPALERLVRRGGKAGELSLRALSQIPGYQAALALARLAVLADDDSTRRLAAEGLRNHNRDHYVPTLLAGMKAPIQTRMLTYTDRGQLHHLVSFEREGHDRLEQHAVRFDPRRAGDLGLQRQLEDHQAYRLNKRIVDALRSATGEQLSLDARACWEWWNATNEVYFDSGKPVRVSGAVTEVYRSELEQQSRIELQRRLAAQSGFICDCLAPGTPIWTQSGQVAVDKLQPGDLVLSQNIDSGELALKPILRTTRRPKSVLVRIRLNDETIEASGGHPFWVAGKGWVRARKLEVGMKLHGVEETHPITAIETGEESESYNLIIADFNSYFVGKQRVLSHDNTVRRPTNSLAPGLRLK